MPGPVVQGVQSTPARAAAQAAAPLQAPIPLLAEGTIKLVLMSSGTVLIARLRHTSDRDGQPRSGNRDRDLNAPRNSRASRLRNPR